MANVCRTVRNVAIIAALQAVAGTTASGQCFMPGWSGEFSTSALGLSGPACTLQTFDADGPGPLPAALYVGGIFTSAGGVPANRLARRRAGQWESVGPVVGSLVAGLGLHDPDGSGPLLPELVAVGAFTSIGGAPAQNVAMWNGTQWSAMGAGLAYLGTGTSSVVDWDHDGLAATPPRLVVTGTFELPGPEYREIMVWDGDQWSPLPSTPGGVTAVAVFDEDGTGPQPPRVFAALDRDPGIVKWNGSAWEVVGGGIRSAVSTCVGLRVIDEDGSGPGWPALFVGGWFTIAGQVSTKGVARWNGQQWSAVGAGIDAQIEDILAVDYTGGFAGPTIYATGWGVAGMGVWRYEPVTGQWPSAGSTNGEVLGLNWLFRLASMDESGSGRPSLYHVSTQLSAVDGRPSFGIARLLCTCRANCDGTTTVPHLTPNDFQCFMDQFAAGSSNANCDGVGGLTGNDFQCFLNSYVAGCN